MSTNEIKDVPATSAEPSAQGIASGNPANSGRDNSTGTSPTQDVSKMQELETKVKVLQDLVFDINNKYNSNQVNTKQEAYEYPSKSIDEVDARTKMIRKEWGL